MSSCRSYRLVVLIVVATALAACSSSTGSGDATGSDAGSADAALSGDEMTALTTSGNSATINAQVNTLADELFDFDPTIDPSATPSANAAAIGANAQMNLGSSCGSVSVSGTSVTVSFGAPPGCTLPDGSVVSGTVTLAVSKASGTTTRAKLG